MKPKQLPCGKIPCQPSMDLDSPSTPVVETVDGKAIYVLHIGLEVDWAQKVRNAYLSYTVEKSK